MRCRGIEPVRWRVFGRGWRVVGELEKKDYPQDIVDACAVLLKTSCKDGYQDEDDCARSLQARFPETGSCEVYASEYRSCVAEYQLAPVCQKDVFIDIEKPEVESCHDAVAAYRACAACKYSSHDTGCDSCKKTNCCSDMSTLARYKEDWGAWLHCVVDCGVDAKCQGDCDSKYFRVSTAQKQLDSCTLEKCKSQCL